jgi:hypothetical protein
VSIIGGASQGAAAYEIKNSLRFRAGNSAYLRNNSASPWSNANKVTFSVWVKRGDVGTTFSPIFGSNTGSAAFDMFGFQNDQLIIRVRNSSVVDLVNLRSNAVFRDPIAWYHIVFVYDSGNVTSSERAKIFVNNQQITSFSVSTYPSLNQAFTGTFTSDMFIGRGNTAAATIHYADCYLADVWGVDNRTLSPTDFGEYGSNGAWVPKSYSGDGGSRTFYLPFSDGTNLTTLGDDKSGRDNDFTLNNISLTAGVTYDWMLDTPSNNFATLNNIYPSAANISNGNLASGTTAARGTFNSTVFDSQWFVTAGASNVTAGVIDDSGSANTTTVTANKVFAFKMTSAGSLSYKNVTDAGSWTSIATGLTGNHWPYSVTAAASWNFGQQPLPEALDTGFKALCTANLPEGETITTSGSFTGNASADGPYIDIKGVPLTMTINGNAVTFGTHADKTAFGFKVRAASASYNSAGTNTYSITSTGAKRKYANAQENP